MSKMNVHVKRTCEKMLSHYFVIYIILKYGVAARYFYSLFFVDSCCRIMTRKCYFHLVCRWRLFRRTVELTLNLGKFDKKWPAPH